MDKKILKIVETIKNSEKGERSTIKEIIYKKDGLFMNYFNGSGNPAFIEKKGGFISFLNKNLENIVIEELNIENKDYLRISNYTFFNFMDCTKDDFINREFRCLIPESYRNLFSKDFLSSIEDESINFEKLLKIIYSNNLDEYKIRTLLSKIKIFCIDYIE